VVGPSTDAAGIQHGFRVDRRGCLVRVDYPGPPRSKNEAVGINDRGQIVGVYGRYGDETTGETHTYVRDRRGFTSYDVPGALATGASKNNDRTADAHGFLFDDGELTLIDARRRPDVPVRHQRPRADPRLRGERRQHRRLRVHPRPPGAYTPLPDVPDALATIPFGVNDRGQVVGFYLDGNGTQHGYLLDRGRFTTIDVPGAAATDAFGINDHGQIVGAFSTTPPPSTLSTMESGPVATPMSPPWKRCRQGSTHRTGISGSAG
jgi:uncharacterized membrane protein